MNWEAVAQARWPKVQIVKGDGRWAFVVKCKMWRVRLFDTREEAEKLLVRYAITGCGLPCMPHGRGSNHFIVDLQKEAA